MIAPLTINGKTFQVTRKVTGKEIAWTAECPDWFQLQDAADLQTTCGYDPAGYSFFSFRLVKLPSGYKATWESLASCD